MKDPRKREDLSRFLVHLTRNYNGKTAAENLIEILADKRIEARNAHCLFTHRIGSSQFSNLLRKKFNTVCFTEAPLHQISRLLVDIPGRSIKLRPYGLVFWRHTLLEKGCNPAIYINAEGTNLREYLLKEFDNHFGQIKTFDALKRVKRDFYDEIIHYYSLVNIIRPGNDFEWEREWRLHGDLEFFYKEVVAIIAPDPDSFLKACQNELGEKAVKFIKRTPIISPNWTYEDIIEEMSLLLWK